MATIAEVKVILPADTQLTDPQIQAAIDAAQCLLDESGCTQCADKVILYLAAHFAAATENTLSLQSEKDGCSDSSATYGFKFGEGIMGTPFGQMANTLSGNCLKSAESGKKPALYAIGCH